MKKKRLLYIAPDHYSFYKVILNGFINYSDYEVHFIYSNKSKDFKYKNFRQRLFNFFLKNITGRNIKKEFQSNYFETEINQYKKYDTLFINRPDIFTDEQLKLIKSKCHKSIVYYWDSFEKIKGQKETMKYFQKTYSFDKYDCENHGMIKAHNFFHNTETIDNPKYDVFFLGTYDSRYDKLIKIIESLYKKKINVHATLFSYDKTISKRIRHKNISFINEIVPFNEAFIFNQNTKIILDIQHDNQVGLSFRPYEAMGLRKKLITTNPNIKEYDFYNPNNVFILDKDMDDIPDSFLNSPYEEISEEIYNKYKLENWVKSILNN